jgi:hypothetical protein
LPLPHPVMARRWRRGNHRNDRARQRSGVQRGGR